MTSAYSLSNSRQAMDYSMKEKLKPFTRYCHNIKYRKQHKLHRKNPIKLGCRIFYFSRRHRWPWMYEILDTQLVNEGHRFCSGTNYNKVQGRVTTTVFSFLKNNCSEKIEKLLKITMAESIVVYRLVSLTIPEN